MVPGEGPKTATMVVLGEAPGYNEDREGRPFVGQSGQLLRNSLRKVGLQPEELYITNVVKDRPPNNRTPTAREIREALPALAEELASLPNLESVLCVGNVALQAVAGRGGITKLRGTLLRPRKDLAAVLDGVNIMATVHPAYVLRNNSYPVTNAFVEDLGTFAHLENAGSLAKKSERVSPLENPEDVARLKAAIRPIGALDIETTPHPWWHPDHRILTVAMAFDGEEAFVIPVDHPESKDPDLLWTLAPLLSEVKWVMHNGKFDRQRLLAAGIDTQLHFDTMAAQYLLDENQRKGLEFLSSLYLGLPPYKDVDYKHLDEEPLDKLTRMNGRDAIRTYRLYSEVYQERVTSEERVNRLFQKLMMPAINSLAEMELGGVPVDVGRLGDLTQRTEERVEELEAAIRRLADDPQLNPRSTQQLQKLLFEKLGLPVQHRTDKGAPSTNKNALLLLRNHHQLVELLLQHREHSKRLSAFLHPWEEYTDHTRDTIHPSYKPAHVVTGRLSSEKPNIQQVPRDVEYRQVFGGVPGWVWVEADYSQIELRIAAWLAEEATMLEAYRTGEDLHALTAELVLGDRARRQTGKAINFGLLYGARAQKLQELAFCDYGVEMSLHDATQYRDAFFERYPNLALFHRTMIAQVHRDKKVFSPIGRVRHLPGVDSSDFQIKSEAERMAINHPIQSFASDIMLLSLTELHRDLDPEEARIVASIHDSLCLLVREDVVDSVLPEVVKSMENPPFRAKFGLEIDVPLVVGTTVGYHWKDK